MGIIYDAMKKIEKGAKKVVTFSEGFSEVYD